jgi:hypothetical protein
MQEDFVVQPELKIIKTVWRNIPVQIFLVVVDLSIGQEYPQNFLCLFPRNLLGRNQKGNLKISQFYRIFGDRTYKVAKSLLEEALKRERDARVRKEIETILKKLLETLTPEEIALGPRIAGGRKYGSQVMS